MRLPALAVAAFALSLPGFAVAEEDAYLDLVNAGKSAYLEHGNLFRSTWNFREAMRLDAKRIEAFRAQGACLVKAKQPDRGVFYLYEALKRSPEDGLTNYWLGMAHTNARRPGPARVFLAKAKATLKEGDFADKATYEAAVKNVDALLVRADKEGAVNYDGKIGKPAKVMFEYAANLYGEPGKEAASVAAGEDLMMDLAFVQVWDSSGRLVDAAGLSFTWGASAGLVKKEKGIAAGAKPGREVLTVTETSSNQMGKADIVVLGPLAGIEVTPAKSAIALNQRLHLEARGVDAAGNRLPVSTLKWSLSSKDLQVGLREETSPDANNPGDPHRNAIEVPETAPAPMEITVTVTDGALKGTATVTVEKRKTDKLQSRAKAIAWENLTLADAIRKAGEQKKLLLVEITAGWCPLCKRFEEGPLSDAKVSEATKDWLAVQIDADQHPALVQRYGIVDLPAVALLSPRGTFLAMFGNNMEPQGIDPRTTTDELLKALEAAKKKAPLADSEEDTKLATVKDAAGRANLARWYLARVRYPEAEAAARKAIEGEPGLTHDMTPIIATVILSEEKTEETIKLAADYLKAFPEGKAAPQLFYYTGLAWKRLKDDDKAKAAFAEVQKKWPTSTWARKAAQAARK